MDEDHRNARLFVDTFVGALGVEFQSVETNIVSFELEQPAADFAKRAMARGVLMNATGKRTLRAVTHLDVTESQVKGAAIALRELLAS